MLRLFTNKNLNKFLLPIYIVATGALALGFFDMLSRFIHYIAVSANISISMVGEQIKLFIHH